MALRHTRCSLNESDFPCQYHSLTVHMRSVMEKGALVQYFGFLLSLTFSPLEICGELRGALTNFSPCIPVFLCHLCTPCEISGGRIGAGTDFSLSLSFHQYPIPIFCMKILPKGQTSEFWEPGRCDWKTTITFLSFVHGSDQTIGRYCLSVLS